MGTSGMDCQLERVTETYDNVTDDATRTYGPPELIKVIRTERYTAMSAPVDNIKKNDVLSIVGIKYIVKSAQPYNDGNIIVYIGLELQEM